MICPQCRCELPSRYALAIRALKLHCPLCRVDLRATRESLASTARAVAPRCTQAGAVVGAIAVAVAIKTDAWWPVAASIGMLFILSLLWSWRVALRHVEFERA